jgi:glycosyltransferase involved in cell wall biosynthesis
MAIHSDARTLEAIASLRDETVSAEIIVVNTGSGSLRGSLAGLLDRIVLIERSRPGLPGLTRNLGLAETHAPIVAFLAADCLATPGWLARRIAAHAEAAAVASAIRPALAADGRVSLSSWASCMLLHPRRWPEYPADGALRAGVSYARELFDRHGTFLEDVRIDEDTEFNRRLPKRPAWAPSIVTQHRYPVTPTAACVDAFRRGQRLHGWMSVHTGWSTVWALRRAAGALWYAMSVIPHAAASERGTLIAAAPLVWVLALAYAAGALSQIGKRPQITAG